jgi:hypothetical protein
MGDMLASGGASAKRRTRAARDRHHTERAPSRPVTLVRRRANGVTSRTGAIAIGALLVGLAVGTAVGYLLGVSPTEEAAPAPATQAAAAAASEPAAADGVAASRPAARARHGTAGPLDLSSLDADVPASPAGDGKITGVVLTDGGSPLAGVLVRATPVHNDDADEDADTGLPAGSPPPRADVERRVRDLVRRLRRAEAEIREATTDASGAYTLAGLSSAPQRVEAWLTGWRIKRTGGSAWAPVAAGGVCDFRATPIHSVVVAVLLPDGTQPDSAEVHWKKAGTDDESSSSWSPRSADVEVQPGTYEFTATSGQGGVYRSSTETLTVASGASQTLTLHLAARPGIRVRIAYASTARPRDVRVAALRLEAGATAEPRLLLGAPHADWVDGGAAECVLADLEPGSYLVGLTFRGGFIGPTSSVTVAGDLSNVELRVTDAEIRDAVKLWVRGPDGELVRDVAKIVCGCRSDGGSGYSMVNASAEADGSFRIPHYETDAPSLGNSSGTSNGGPGATGRTYYVEVRSAAFGDDTADYDPAADREVTIRLGQPARLRVTIGGYAQNPDRDRLGLELRATGESARRNAHDLDDADITIDSSGVAVLGPVKPGTYEVVLSLAKADDSGPSRSRRHYSWNSTELMRTPLTLAVGENSVTMAVASLTDLTVVVEGPGRRLRLDSVGPDGFRRPGRSAQTESNSEGSNEIAFASLAPGRYRLASDEGDMFVTVPDERRVTFRPRPFNAYYLVVTEKGYLAELGLKTGDLVVSIDGTEFKDKLGMDAALATAKTRESSKFGILRSGRQFEVAADGRRFEEDEGSTYSPWVR